MRIAIWFALVFAHLMPAPAVAKDLPTGEYVLLGNVLPGIQDGFIVPIFVHLLTTGDQMNWTFITSYIPDKHSCESGNKCDQAIAALRHKVQWQPDSSLKILSTDRMTGPGMAIDREDFDGPYVLDPIQGLVSRGQLELSADGGVFTLERRGQSRKVIDLAPVALDDLMDAIAFVKGFEISLGKLNHCAIRQVVKIMADEDRSEIEQQVVDATRFMGRFERVSSDARYHLFGEEPESERAEIKQKSILSAAMKVAAAVPRHDVTTAMLDGKPLTDAEILAISTEFVSRVAKSAGEYYPALIKEILETRRHQLLATIKVFSRLEVLRAKGHVLETAICQDVTLKL